MKILLETTVAFVQEDTTAYTVKIRPTTVPLLIAPATASVQTLPKDLSARARADILERTASLK